MKYIFKNVNSSLIESYARHKTCMVIKFKNGSYYRYFKVSDDIVGEFENAESKGSYFSTKIKNVFDFEIIDIVDGQDKVWEYPVSRP